MSGTIPSSLASLGQLSILDVNVSIALGFAIEIDLSPAREPLVYKIWI
jgi:hypothetical protein